MLLFAPVCTEAKARQCVNSATVIVNKIAKIRGIFVLFSALVGQCGLKCWAILDAEAFYRSSCFRPITIRRIYNDSDGKYEHPRGTVFPVNGYSLRSKAPPTPNSKFSLKLNFSYSSILPVGMHKVCQLLKLSPFGASDRKL